MSIPTILQGARVRHKVTNAEGCVLYPSLFNPYGHPQMYAIRVDEAGIDRWGTEIFIIVKGNVMTTFDCEEAEGYAKGTTESGFYRDTTIDQRIKMGSYVIEAVARIRELEAELERLRKAVKPHRFTRPEFPVELEDDD